MKKTTKEDPKVGLARRLEATIEDNASLLALVIKLKKENVSLKEELTVFRLQHAGADYKNHVE